MLVCLIDKGPMLKMLQYSTGTIKVLVKDDGTYKTEFPIVCTHVAKDRNDGKDVDFLHHRKTDKAPISLLDLFRLL